MFGGFYSRRKAKVEVLCWHFLLCLMSKMIQISTFPAAPSTERVPSLAERVASLRYSINLQLLNNRVPGLVDMYLFRIAWFLVWFFLKWQIFSHLDFLQVEWPNLGLRSQSLLTHSPISSTRQPYTLSHLSRQAGHFLRPPHQHHCSNECFSAALKGSQFFWTRPLLHNS